MSKNCLAALLFLAVISTAARGGPMVQVLSPGGSMFGDAYGVDGFNVVGSTGSVGFLYDGSKSSKIAYPGASLTVPRGITGNKIVGYYQDSVGYHGFLDNGSSYTAFDAPLGKWTFPYGIDGNKIVGSYVDASNKWHGFLNDGTSWTTLDDPLGAQGTFMRGISGSNIVGSYVDAGGQEHGFLNNGTTWKTLNDVPNGPGNFTAAYGVSGNNVVGEASAGGYWGFLYDGSTFTHPLGFTGNGAFPDGSSNFVFYGISGNRIVGAFNDAFYHLDRPFVVTIPEPSALVLATIGAAFAALAAMAPTPAIAHPKRLATHLASGTEYRS